MIRKIQRTVRCARRRLRGNKDADRNLLEALEQTALLSYTRRCAINSLRYRLSRLYMESDGFLFEFMLLWFIGGLSCVNAAVQKLNGFRTLSSREQVREVIKGSQLLQIAKDLLHSDFFIKPEGEVAYQRLVNENRVKLMERFPSILHQLAVLEKDDIFGLPKGPLQFNQIKMPDPDPYHLLELAIALNEHWELTLLCSPKPMLSHLENFQIALLHARLWLLGSDLPVCFGSHVTYKHLREGLTTSMPFKLMLSERAKEQLPSVVEIDHMSKTVLEHSTLDRDTEEVYHMKEEDFAKSSRWNVPGHPVPIVRGEKEQSLRFQARRLGLVEDEDVCETVRAFEEQEPPRIVSELRKLNANAFAKYSECLSFSSG